MRSKFELFSMNDSNEPGRNQFAELILLTESFAMPSVLKIDLVSWSDLGSVAGTSGSYTSTLFKKNETDSNLSILTDFKNIYSFLYECNGWYTPAVIRWVYQLNFDHMGSIILSKQSYLSLNITSCLCTSVAINTRL